MSHGLELGPHDRYRDAWIQLFSTAALACSRSGSARTRFGCRFFLWDFDFGIGDGLLHRRRQLHRHFTPAAFIGVTKGLYWLVSSRVVSSYFVSISAAFAASSACLVPSCVSSPLATVSNPLALLCSIK
jgi:hypothetical protein